MTKYIDAWGCDACGSICSKKETICEFCDEPLMTVSDKVASGYTIQFHAKGKDGSIRAIHEMTIAEGDEYLGFHIEGFIEDKDVETIEVILAPSDKLYVRSSADE